MVADDLATKGSRSSVTMILTYLTRHILISATERLTHWSRVTHICVSKLTIIGPDNGLSPGRRQAIIWTNDGILLIGPLGTNFSEILIEMYIFSFKKMHLKMSSGNWQPFCLGLNILILKYQSIIYNKGSCLGNASADVQVPSLCQAITNTSHRGIDFSLKVSLDIDDLEKKSFTEKATFCTIANMISWDMMVPLHENAFHITGPLWGESTGPQWIPSQRASDALMFSLSLARTSCWIKS